MRSHGISSIFFGNSRTQGSARRARQAIAVAALAVLSVGCAVSSRVSLPPLPIVAVFNLLAAVLPAGSSGASYGPTTVSTNLTTSGTGTVSACQFVSAVGTAPGSNVVPAGLMIAVGTPPGGAAQTGCTITGVIGDSNGNGMIDPGEGVAPGTYTFTVRAADSSSPPQSDTQTYTIIVSSLQIMVSDSPDPTVTGQNITITWTFTVSGSPSTPNQQALVELLGPTMLVEDSCTALLTALGCGPLQSTTAGAHTVRLTYPNPPATDPNFPGTTTATTPHTVNVAPTTTTVTTVPDPTVSGQMYAANVVVAPNAPGGGAPTGTVAVSDGLGNSCNAPLTPGVNQSTGTCNLNGPTAGPRTVTANYPGSANYAASMGSDPHTVNPANTTTTITSDAPDPSVTGQAYVVNWTVAVNAPGAGTPTGTVTVDDGDGAVCSAAVAAGTCTITSAIAAAKTLTANYSGDANFNASSDTEAHVVNQASTTTTITSDLPDPSVTGETYTVNVTVDTNAPGAGQPAGTVTINDGQGQSCMAALAPGPGANQSTGTCMITSLTTAVTTLTANYPGNPNFAASSDTEAHTVTLAPTTTTITMDAPDPSAVGQAFTVDVTVAPNPPGTGAPTGSVMVSDGFGGTCTIAALTPGVNQSTGSCMLTSNTTSVTSVTATYSGDANFNGSMGSAPHAVTLATTTTTITSDNPDPSVVGQTITVNVTVAPNPPGMGAPTGSVMVNDGFGGNCVIAALTPGVNQSTGSCMLTPVTTSVTSITATYSGDVNFGGGVGMDNHVVNPAATTTTITMDNPDPSVVLSAYTVDFTVAPVAPGMGAPTGNVTVVDGFGGSCIGVLAPGVNMSTGSCMLASVNFNVTTLTATYSGDPNFTGSMDTEGHMVTALTTTTTINLDTPDPSQVGETVMVTATVQGSPVGGPPTGTLTISDGIGGSCMAALVLLTPDSSFGTCNLMPTPVATPVTLTLSASYPGDGAIYSGSADTEPHDVNPALTTTALMSSVNPSVSGQTVTFTATVSPVPPAGGTPTGTVQFQINGVNAGAPVALVGGMATLMQAFNASVSPQNIDAIYSGDANFAPSTTLPLGTLVQNIAPANTTTALMSSANPSVSGENVTFTATVTANAPGAGTPTGSVLFFVNGLPFGGPVALVGGVATSVTTTFTVAGSPRSVDASYSGDADFNGSVAATLSQVTNQAASTVIVTPPGAPTVTGETYTVNVTVGATAPGGGTPTGSVTISDGLDTCNIAALAGGMGNCMITSTTAGSKTLTATYSGDTEFSGNNGTAMHTVNPATTIATVNDKQVLAASQNTTVSGEDYEVLVTVVTQAPGAGEPTGMVMIQDDNATPTDSCLATLVSSGPGTNTSTGVCTILNSRSQNNATDNIQATYQGDGNFAVNTGALFPHVVNKGGTGLNGGANIIKSVDPTVVGQTYTVTVSVNASIGEGNPTGTVDVDDGQGAMCTTGALAPGPGLNQSTASCMLTSTTVASNQLNASYAGDADFNGVSASNAHTVNVASTTTVITMDTPDPSGPAAPYTVSFTVNATAPGGGQPTGIVTVSDQDAVPATCMALLAPGPGANQSSGSCMIISNPAVFPVTLNLIASYPGDANYSASVSPNEPHLVDVVSIAAIALGDGVEGRMVGTGTSGLAGVRFPITGGSAPYVCTDPGATLPLGVIVVTAVTGTHCELQGTPAGGSAGNYMVDITVTDASLSAATTGPMSWDIRAPLMITDPPGMADAVEDRNYAFTFDSTMLGGIPGYTWSEMGSSLGAGGCAGFGINAAGDLTGTQPLVGGGGACNFTVQVMDTASTTTMAGTATQAQMITVQPMLTIVTAELVNGKRGNTYLPISLGGAAVTGGDVIQSSGGTGTPVTYTVTAGTFTLMAGVWTGDATTPCEGLMFNETGFDAGSGNALDTVVNGTGTVAGTCTFTVEVNDNGSGATGPDPTPPSTTFDIIVFDTFAYVANSGANSIGVVNTATNAFVTNIAVGTSTNQVAIASDGRAVVASSTAAEQIVIVDASTNMPVLNSPFDVSGSCDQPEGVLVAPSAADTYLVFVACSGTDGATGERVVTYSFDTNASTLTPVNTADFDPAGGITRQARRMAFTPDMTTIFVSIDRGAGVTGSWVRLSSLDGSLTDETVFSGTGASDECREPRGVAISQTNFAGNPIEAYFACAAGSENDAETVSIVDVGTNAQSTTNVALAPATSPALPDSIAFITGANPDRAYITLTGSDEVAIVDTSARSQSDENLPTPGSAIDADSDPFGIAIPVPPNAAPTIEIFTVLGATSGAPSPGVAVWNDGTPPVAGTNNPISLTSGNAPRGIAAIPIPR